MTRKFQKVVYAVTIGCGKAVIEETRIWCMLSPSAAEEWGWHGPFSGPSITVKSPMADDSGIDHFLVFLLP